MSKGICWLASDWIRSYSSSSVIIGSVTRFTITEWPETAVATARVLISWLVEDRADRSRHQRRVHDRAVHHRILRQRLQAEADQLVALLGAPSAPRT